MGGNAFDMDPFYYEGEPNRRRMQARAMSGRDADPVDQYLYELQAPRRAENQKTLSKIGAGAAAAMFMPKYAGATLGAGVLSQNEALHPNVRAFLAGMSDPFGSTSGAANAFGADDVADALRRTRGLNTRAANAGSGAMSVVGPLAGLMARDIARQTRNPWSVVANGRYADALQTAHTVPYLAAGAGAGAAIPAMWGIDEPFGAIVPERR